MISLTCNVRQMKSALQAFRAIDKEAMFIFKPSGLKIWMLDKTSAMLLDMDADKSAFLDYRCDEEKTIVLDIDAVIKSLSRTMEDDTLLISFAEKSNEAKFHIIKRENRKITSNREFSFGILEQSVKYQEFKNSNEDEFKITSALWKTAIMDMGLGEMKGNFSFIITKDKIKFLSGEKGVSKSKVEYHKSRLRSITLKNEQVACEFGLTFIYAAFKALPDDLLLEFKVATGKPLICRFEMTDVKLGAMLNSQPFKFMLLLAPIVSREEEKVFDDSSDGLEVGNELDVPILDKKEEEKGLEIGGEQ